MRRSLPTTRSSLWRRKQKLNQLVSGKMAMLRKIPHLCRVNPPLSLKQTGKTINLLSILVLLLLQVDPQRNLLSQPQKHPPGCHPLHSQHQHDNPPSPAASQLYMQKISRLQKNTLPEPGWKINLFQHSSSSTLIKRCSVHKHLQLA